jgi:AAA+ superfamily predicted ATPase
MPEMLETPLALAQSADDAFADAAYLTHQVAVMAGRLAQLIGDAPMAREHPVSAGVTFLRAVAAAAAETKTSDPAIPRQPRIERLAAGYRLTRIDIDLLILAGMAEEHEGFGSVFRALHPRGEPRPTAGLAAQLLCDSPRDRLLLRDILSVGAAVRSGALSLAEEGPFFERSLLLADLLWPALVGVDAWPARVRPLATSAGTIGLEEWLAGDDVARTISALQSNRSVVIVVVAEDGQTAVHRALALAEYAGVSGVALEYTSDSGREETERLVALHAAVRGAVPIIRVTQPADGTSSATAGFRDVLGPVVLCTREGTAVAHDSRPVLTVRAPRLALPARRRMWSALLPELADAAPKFSARYALEPHSVRAVAGDVRQRAALEARVPRAGDVAESVRARENVTRAAGVRDVHPTAGWDRLILAEDRKRQLREALDRLLHQGRVLDEWGFLAGRPGARGVRMLFAGPPGTGKTLAAEVLAHTIGVDLLVVDLARVVSKWIGETEKNLSDVFDAAEGRQSVLLFDEADALFGKRTEVQDAHDRYANLETAYLLARLERFDGLAILSTNLRDNIDAAFTRRLEFVVDFDEPSVDEREAIWQCHLPGNAPLAPDVRMQELASLYPIVGGHIRNAAVAAAFLAAAADAPITRSHLVLAVRREYEKSGRAFPGAPVGTFTA